MTMVIPTSSDNVAFSIALGVLLLSVVLHPIVRWCFHRIRANVAWKSIEKQRPVEVTKYNIFSEALGDRGRWDMARVVTILLAAFHVSTWGLELSLDLALRTDGPVDLLNRPPPVVFRTQVADVAHNLSDWIVMRNEEAVVEGGSLDHFRGTLVDGNATTTYRIGDSIIRGNTVFASWSPQSSRIASGLFYDVDDGQAIVSEVACSTPSRTGSLYITAEESNKWGDVSECESGPSLVNASADDRASPPVILLNSTAGEVYLIVEEESSYPSFLYSVWMPGEVTPQEAQLNHVFYVSSTTRLVEAIVSGIANGIANGGGCFDMLTKYSVQNATYSLNGALRVSPFGEHPRSSSVESLDQVEPIVAGVLVSDMGTVCGAMLIVVTGAAFAGCLCCHSRKALDVYDRDQLIRAISLPSGEGADGKPAAIKIYVRQEQDNAFSIVISDDGVYRGCAGLKKRLLASMKNDSSALENSVHSMSGSGVLPLGTRELTFDGVRSSMGDSDGHQQHAEPDINQRCSPVPVPTPARTPARRATVVGLVASPVASPVQGARAGVTRRRQLALTLEDLDGSSSTTVGTIVEDRSSVASEAPKGERTAPSTRARKSMGRDDVEAPAPAAE
ncbi:unnamed protein product [Ectocarpus fasciculatus]